MIGDRPAVSVVMPVRDGAATLEAALASLAAQTFTDFEVVIHDDGSKDATAEILEAWAYDDARLRFASHSARGIVAGLNGALARSRAPLLVRMDADDTCHPERLAALVEAAGAHPEADFFASLVEYGPPDAVGEGMRRYEAWLNDTYTHRAIVRDRFVELPLLHPSWALRRRLWERVGPYREGPFPEDYEWFLRAVAAGARFHKVPRVLYTCTESPTRTSWTDTRCSLEAFRGLKADVLRPRLLDESRGIGVIGGGKDAKRWVRALQARGIAVSLRVDTRVVDRSATEGPQVVSWEHLPSHDAVFLLVALGRRERREAARASLEARGFAEDRDFLCVQ